VKLDQSKLCLERSEPLARLIVIVWQFSHFETERRTRSRKSKECSNAPLLSPRLQRPAMLTAFIVALVVQPVPTSSGIPTSALCPNGRNEGCPSETEWWHNDPEAAFKEGDTIKIAGLVHTRRSGGWVRQSSANPFEDPIPAWSGPGRHELVARVAGSPYRRVYATGRQCHRARSAIVASTRQAEAEARTRGIMLSVGFAPVCIPID